MQTAIKEHIDYLKSLKRSQKVIINTGYSLRLFSDFMKGVGIINTLELNPSHIDSWFMYQTERTNREGLPLKASAINCDLVKLKGFLKFLYKRDQIKSKLYERVELLKLPKHLPTSLLSDEEFSRFIQEFDLNSNLGFRNKTIASLLYSTGIRVGELCALSIGDIDFEQSTALIFGKGSKERLVPIGDSMLHLLQSYVKSIRPFFIQTTDAEPLFFTNRGRRITLVSVQKMIKAVSLKAGFNNITPHSLRRSFATELIKANANIYHVKEMMGHEGLNQLKHYVKLNIKDLQTTHKKCHPRG